VIYLIHEFQQAATESVRTAMQAGQVIMRNPLTHTDFGRRSATACELIDYTTQRRSRPEFHLKTVDPGAITDIGLLTVEDELDDISDVGQTRSAHDRWRNLPDVLKRHHHQEAPGHYDIFNDRRWRNEILPQVREAVLATA
jgi:poly-beta-hydroxyalkanoate depolymerase